MTNRHPKQKNPGRFYLFSRDFLSIISRITPLSSSCSSADTFSPTYSKSVQSPLRCRHSNRDPLLLYNRSMGDLFMRVLYRVRPYEKEKGSANRLYQSWVEKK